MLKLKEDLCGITQESWLGKFILHGFNIIVSIISDNLVRVYGWELLMLKLKEDWCGTTQESWLGKFILHGFNIIVSIISDNLVRVIWLGASYVEAEGRLVGNHSGKLVGKGYSAWLKYYSLHYLGKSCMCYVAGRFCC